MKNSIDEIPTRSLNRRIVWPKLIREFEKNGQKFCIRPIAEKDISPLALFFQTHSSYFYGSTRQNFFDESFYKKESCLLENWETDSKNKLHFFGILETLPEKKMIMGFGCVRDPYDLVIQNLNVTLDPTYRGQDIAGEYVHYLDTLWQQSGADYTFGYMSTRHVLSQKMFLKLGGKFGGILPGILRRTLDGKNYYRDTELFMYKFFNGAENYLSPLQNCQVVPELEKDMRDLLNEIKSS